MEAVKPTDRCPRCGTAVSRVRPHVSWSTVRPANPKLSRTQLIHWDCANEIVAEIRAWSEYLGDKANPRHFGPGEPRQLDSSTEE